MLKCCKITDLSNFSGGIFCDSAGVTCGGTAIGVSGVIYREGHTYVLNHGVTADNAAGSLGFKLSYIQLPCSASGTSYTTVQADADNWIIADLNSSKMLYVIGVLLGITQMIFWLLLAESRN